MKTEILLIEPDAFLAGIYASKFEAERMGVVISDSIADARKRVAKASPSAIVIDVEIGNEAYEFVNELRTNTELLKTPIIVATALGDRESIAKAFAAGATDYLIKGHFVPIEAARKVKKLIQGM